MYCLDICTGFFLSRILRVGILNSQKHKQTAENNKKKNTNTNNKMRRKYAIHMHTICDAYERSALGYCISTYDMFQRFSYLIFSFVIIRPRLNAPKRHARSNYYYFFSCTNIYCFNCWIINT